MKNFKPGITPTLITLPLIIVLLGLSFWQLNRYQWKVGLLDNIQQQLSEDATALPSVNIDPENWQYRRVFLTGRFLHDKEIHLFAHAEKGQKGFHIITPFERADGAGIVLVNRGWVPERLKDAATRPQGNIEGDTEISGIVRKAWTKSYSFLPDSDPEKMFGFLASLTKWLHI